MYQCTNCEEDIEEGTELWDELGQPFCCQEHLDWYHEDDEKEAVEE